jgi:hypothetical protein
MKPAKATFALIVVLAGLLASEPVLARSGGGHSGSHSGSHSHGGHRASHARSVIVGSAVFWPNYYYQPYALPAVEPAPWGYIEQGTDSYYCAETQKNYPDAQDCPGAWQLITPVPTPGS